jgi:hypothetical protein
MNHTLNGNAGLPVELMLSHPTCTTIFNNYLNHTYTFDGNAEITVADENLTPTHKQTLMPSDSNVSSDDESSAIVCNMKDLTSLQYLIFSLYCNYSGVCYWIQGCLTFTSARHALSTLQFFSNALRMGIVCDNVRLMSH